MLSKICSHKISLIVPFYQAFFILFYFTLQKRNVVSPLSRREFPRPRLLNFFSPKVTYRVRLIEVSFLRCPSFPGSCFSLYCNRTAPPEASDTPKLGHVLVVHELCSFHTLVSISVPRLTLVWASR